MDIALARNRMTWITRWSKVIGRWLCIASYVLCIVVAYGDFRYPSTIVERLDANRVAINSVIMAFFGLLGIIAVFAHRWRIEWLPANVLTFLLLARATPLWANLDDVPTRLSAAAMMTLGALCLAKRALDLVVFSEETRLAAQIKDSAHASG